MAKIRITNTREMYHTLTDEKQLALVLDEGLDPENLQYRDQMIEYFTGIRDRIDMEDIRVLPAITCIPAPTLENAICVDIGV